ncbi:RNA demethylase ALKBH9B-like isoform X2 [Tripterygium wilfordii]|uniref:RNA demethylase ALKBH9B-like isoform X2 n=1 Tax=Tripterygium wilfordii TaxID=458696 RepID=UPI0018F83F6E|nr:RNA demethylase ALKBH9B-like isoform X2 [Tripterygium wilfordii]
MPVTGDLDRIRKDDPFLMQYQPSELRVASEFLTTWLPFLSRDLCHNCTQNLSDRIRSLDPEALHSDKSVTSLSPNNEESGETIEKYEDNYDTYSRGSCKDGDDTNSLDSWKDGENGCCEPHKEASSSGLTSGSPSVDITPSPRISWADMAQEDELEEEEEEEEESELNKRVVNRNPLSGDLTVTKVIEKPTLSRDQREYIRFKNVKRKKDFICLERVNGKIVNILGGLELHSGVFSAAEQKRIVEEVYALEEKGKRGELKERTYSAPKKWMRGKGRVTIQFGCCYNYSIDKMGNPQGILQKETVDPLPSLFKVIIRRLVKWHVLPPSCVPDSCIVNIYEEGDCIPPHIDNHDFVRPFCTVSFLSECNIVFGSNLKILAAGEFAGSIAIPLPVGSVLVLNGNGADVAKHCVPAVAAKRISITFRKMDESKRPIGFVPEPDLQGIQPLSYETGKVKRLDSPKSHSRIKRQPFRREGKMEGRGFSQRSYTQPEPHYLTRTRQGPIYKRRFRMNPDY